MVTHSVLCVSPHGQPLILIDTDDGSVGILFRGLYLVDLMTLLYEANLGNMIFKKQGDLNNSV